MWVARAGLVTKSRAQNPESITGVDIFADPFYLRILELYACFRTTYTLICNNQITRQI